MIDLIFSLIFLLLLRCSSIIADIETLHYESACLQPNNLVQLHLQCPSYEHIQIIRVIYGYTKQSSPPPNFQQCQFSIYDCIQEGTSQNILSCNGKETCSINLTKSEMLATAINTHSVPNCPDFNYIQVNFACIPDSKDICDSWKDDAPVIHLSHSYSKNQLFNRCHCKIRSSIPNGQVLLHAREINRQYGSLKSLIQPKTSSNIDCKKTTYLEIATDRFERKCMDMFPSTSAALFGSGSHNFTLTYLKNDPLSELFFFLELKASPMKKDHHVQIICNWRRRSTTTMTTTLPISTTPMISTTVPVTRQRKRTTMSMQRGGKLSRLDLIRHRPGVQIIEDEHVEMEDTTTDIVENEYQEETTVVEGGEEEEEETDVLTTTVVIKTKKTPRKRTSIASLTTTTKTTTSSNDDDDEEWLRILSLAESESQPKELLSINNRTFVSAIQPSIINSDEKTRHSSSSTMNTLLLVLLLLLLLTFLILLLYCLKVKRTAWIQRLKLNANVAFLFCCEAGKLLFCSSNSSPHPTYSITNTPASTIRHRPSSTMPDYQSSEYYMDETGTNHCRTIASIYDAGGGGDGGGKSIYSIDYDEEETEYTTKYGRHRDGSC